MRFAIVSAIVLAVSCPSLAQNIALHQGRVQELGVKLRPNEWALDNPACDGKGNVFVAAWNPGGDLPGDRPTLMFDSNGSLKAEFASSRKDLHLPSYEDVTEPAALRPDGGVARLAWSMHWLSMAAFSADGKLESRTKLDPPAFIPEQFAVFPSGELLVTGLEDVHTVRALGAFKSFTALYDKNGHLLKVLHFPKDVEIDAAAELGDSRYAHGPMFGNRAVSGGAMRLGDDGNVYLLRRTSPATVYVIASSGELLRTLEIEPAFVGQMPWGMQVAGGRIALKFNCEDGQCEGETLTVADAITGEQISDYTYKGYGEFVCYSASPERFTFLTVSDAGRLQRVEAGVK